MATDGDEPKSTKTTFTPPTLVTTQRKDKPNVAARRADAEIRRGDVALYAGILMIIAILIFIMLSDGEKAHEKFDYLIKFILPAATTLIGYGLGRK